MLYSRVVAALKTSVTLNGLEIPFPRVVQSLARFCRPLAFHNEGEDYELSMVGSAFAVRVLGRNFLVSSQHQLGSGAAQRAVDDVVMIINTDRGHLAVTGNEAIRMRLGPQDSMTEQDVFILRFDDVRDGRQMANFFCRLGTDQFKDPSDLPAGSKVLAFIAIGFPSRHQDYVFDWDEETSTIAPGDIRSRWVQVYLDAAERNGWDKDELIPFQIDSEQVNAIGDLDGLSGSPILMLYQNPDLQAHFAVAGMVLWASKAGRVNAFPGHRLGEAFSAMADKLA